MQGIGRRGTVAGLATVGFATRAWAQGACPPVSGKLVATGAVTIDALCGPVEGARLDTGCVFLGIPYAAPPVGPLRFASPVALPRWTAPFRAAGGPASIQTLRGAAAWLYEGGWPQDEACLGLNVWSPNVRGKRPVMVWLHGGAWRTGMGNAAGTTGQALMQAGVVLVTVNYRLGALGWLAHPALRDSETGAFANWGLQDQVAALRWVKHNIAAFGGDPDNITLFGQSAGGSSTMSIAQDDRNAGLLHKAIIESGSLHGAPGFPLVETAAAYTETLAKRLNTDVPGLRALPALAVHQAELQLARDPAMVRSLGRPPVLPVLDGVAPCPPFPC
jgi:para-nitrobenzyl esterase